MLDAPVEWVPGDSYWPRVSFAIQGTLWAVLGSLAAIQVVFFGLPGVFGPLHPWPFGATEAWQSILDLVAPWFVAGIASTWLLGSRWPVNGPIGISPGGLSVPKMFRGRSVPWSEIRWLDAKRIQVSGKHGSLRLMLTPHQAARIRHFFGQG